MCFNDNTAKAAEKGKKEYKKAMEEIRGWLSPFVSGGQAGFEEFVRRAFAGPGEFKESPGYEWAKKEALDSLNAKAYASGTGGGALQKSRMRYAEGLASQEYGNWLNQHYASLNPFMQISQIGLNAANQLSGFRQNTAQGVAQMLLTQGQAKDANTQGWLGAGMGLASLGLGGFGLAGLAGIGPLSGLATTFGSGAGTGLATGAALGGGLSSLGSTAQTMKNTPGLNSPASTNFFQ